jgi:hypothetical protein
VFFGNSQAEPRGPRAILFVENRKHLVATAFRFFKDATKRGRIKKPVASPEAAIRLRARCRGMFRGSRNRGRLVLGREQNPALGPPPFQHKAPRLRCHARSKAVCACALQIAWLKCAFHFTDTCVFGLRRFGGADFSLTSVGPLERRPARVRGGPNSVNRIRPYDAYRNPLDQLRQCRDHDEQGRIPDRLAKVE